MHKGPSVTATTHSWTQLDTALHSAPRTAEVTCSITCYSIDLRQINFQCLMAQVPTYTTLLQPAQVTL